MKILYMSTGWDVQQPAAEGRLPPELDGQGDPAAVAVHDQVQLVHGYEAGEDYDSDDDIDHNGDHDHDAELRAARQDS